MITIEEIEAQLAAADRLKLKPKPAPVVARPVDMDDVRQHPEKFVRVAGSENFAHRCEGKSSVHKGRCGRAALNGRKRCRMHGGLSRGPTTPEGLARCVTNLIHGEETAQARRDRKCGTARARVLSRAVDSLLKFEQRRRRT